MTSVAVAGGRLLEEFRGYLLEERGLAAGLGPGCMSGSRACFSAERSEPLGEDLARLSGAEINAFVLREARGVAAVGRDGGVRAAGAVAVLARAGLDREPLAAAVPSVAARREDLPRGLAGWAGEAVA